MAESYTFKNQSIYEAEGVSLTVIRPEMMSILMFV